MLHLTKFCTFVCNKKSAEEISADYTYPFSNVTPHLRCISILSLCTTMYSTIAFMTAALSGS